MKPTQQLHELGQSLWLDNITRTMLDDGTLAGLHRRALGHRADLEPDDLRQGDRRRRRLRRADRRAQAARARRRGAVLRARAHRPAPRRGAVPRRSTSAPTASTAGSRSRSRRCSPTTPRRRSPRPRDLHARADRATSSSRSRAPRQGLPAIEESIFAGVPINVTLLFSTRAVPGRRRRLHARHRAPHRGRARPGGRLGGVAVHQPLGRRGGRRRVPDELRNRLGIAVGQARLRAPTASCSTPSAGSASPTRARGRSGCCGRAPGPRTPRPPTCSTSRRSPRRSRSTRCPRRPCSPSPTTARSASRCPPTAATPRRCWRSFADAGIDVDALATRLQERGRRGLRQVLAGAARVDRRRSARRSPPRAGADGLTSDVAPLRERAAWTALERAPRRDRGPPPARPVRRRPRARRAPDRRGRRASTSTTRRTGSPTRRSRLLVALAEESRARASGARRCSAASRSTSPRTARCCTSALRMPRERSLIVDGDDVVQEVHEVLDRMARVRRARARRRAGRATPASRSATSSTSASAARTSAR